jgi:hypothetical protein
VLDHPSGAAWRIERQGKKWDVLVRLPAATDDRQRLLNVHVWSIASDDADLLRSLMMVGVVPKEKK